MRAAHGKVMTIVNRLAAQGIGRRTAMLKAWVLVKMPLIETKVSGVTYGNRQEAIEHLARYQPEAVHIQLVREVGNQYDKMPLQSWRWSMARAAIVLDICRVLWLLSLLR